MRTAFRRPKEWPPFSPFGSSPQTRAGDAGAFDQRTQLQPGDFRVDREICCAAGKSAVGACDYILAPHDPCPALYTLSNKFRMLDEIRYRIYHARNQNFVRRQFALFEGLPLVLLARIA